ncbi:hypothetical protein GY45DRAFT_1439507 [Cubamyces sp. BRFM 1775]|nr:hypothetical protein GY45DRAFT_1439507 [Cubamyces sp. BRFM 1775]
MQSQLTGLTSASSSFSSLRDSVRKHDRKFNPLQGRGVDDPHISKEWDLPSPATRLHELQADYTEAQRREAQSEIDKVAFTLHCDTVKRWKKELDTLLVYAGLSSAVITAFNVESYTLLQPGGAESILRTSRAHGDIAVEFQPPAFAVWINCLWFSSLILSLASASITLLVKQWLDDEDSTTGFYGQTHISAQIQYRRAQSYTDWKVPQIRMLVPVLLQLALITFLVGLIVLLYHLHVVVAAVSSVLIGLFFLFFLLVTVLPVWRLDCCYRAPQARFLYFAFTILTAITWCFRVFIDIWAESRRSAASLQSLALPALQRWLARVSRIPRTWEAQERFDLLKQSADINACIAAAVYDATLDPSYLAHICTALSGDTEPSLVDFLRDIGVFNYPSPAAVLAYEHVRTTPIVLTALRQLLTVEWGRHRPRLLWEYNLRQLFSMSTTTMQGDVIPPGDELILRTMFYVAWETRLAETRYSTFSYLLGAVTAESIVSRDYSVMSHVLVATEKWIMSKVTLNEDAKEWGQVPQDIVAFTIIVHGMLRLMTGYTAVPDTQQDHFEWLQAQARSTLGLIPDFLPSGEALLGVHPPGDMSLCDELAFGLQLLLGPLTLLSRSVDSADPSQRPFVDVDVVDRLEYVWGTADTVLRPDRPLENAHPQSRSSITERLRLLYNNVNSLFPYAETTAIPPVGPVVPLNFVQYIGTWGPVAPVNLAATVSSFNREVPGV